MMPALKHSVLLLAACLLAAAVPAQVVLDRAVIGSTGSFSEAGPISLSATAGEAVVPTFSVLGLTLTQGFQQPRVASELELTVSLSGTNSTCLNTNDGVAVATVTGGTTPYTYDWADGVNTTDTAIDLAPDIYSVLVTDADGRTGMGFVTIDADLNEDCGLTIYNGFTPNGDNHNDYWMIQNVEDFPDNSVEIFNRWGDPVWNTTSYNNETNHWTGLTMGGYELPEGTYFYLVSYNGEVKKGWVQITR